MTSYPRRWGAPGCEGKYVLFTKGQFKGRKAHLTKHAGDYFYYAEDPLNGEKIHGYMSEMEFIDEDGG